MPGPSSPPGLSHPISSAIAPTLARISAADRGSTRERNHQTALSRANHFVAWCTARRFSDTSFTVTSPQEAGEILAAYAQEVSEGDGLARTTQPDIKTVQGYIRAASQIAITAGHNDPRFLPLATDKVGQRLYVPLLAQVFASVRKWTPPKRPERQPICFRVISDLISQVDSAPGSELLLPAAIRDAVIIGTFTGSRVSEYAQSQLRAGMQFQSVPVNSASGSQGGNPIAFMLSDFLFYSKNRVEMSPSAASRAAYL